jgi:O-methyltransferase involved in polyketide biosynthesis
LTVCGRALGNQLPHPILADAMSEEIVHKIDYDSGKFHLTATPVINIAHRVKQLDEVARFFLTRNPRAVGLDLGAGLDTRVFRIALPTTVDWYNIDFPEVIAARRQLLPDRANVHGIGTDLVDPTWFNAIPARPAVIVADGLLAFLTQHDMISLLDRLVSHFPRGEVAFNGYTRFAIWAAKHYHGTQSVAELIRSPGFDDPHEPECWNPRLKLIKEILLMRESEVDEFPVALRLFTRLAAHSTGWSRCGTTVLHYHF